MKYSRQAMTYGLMTSSIFLLLVLQLFWLRSSYERAYFDLRRETSGLFRNTVFAMRDSIFSKRIELVPSADTVLFKESGVIIQGIDTGRATWRARQKGDVKVRQHAKSFQIYLSSTKVKDSLQTVINPLITKLHSGQLNGQGRFIVRFDLDSLNTDSLQTDFQSQLDLAGLAMSFTIRHHRLDQPPIDFNPPLHSMIVGRNEGPMELRDTVHIFSASLASEPVRLDPIHGYSVVVSGIRPLLIKEITPQILFSFFLTALTSVAFLFMHRSIRAQQKLMELKNDFISNISHELKTPVTTVSVALEALRNFRGLENPKLTQEYLDIAQSELNRLTLLTDKVLKTAIFETRGVSFEPEPVDLEKLISQILGSMKLLFEKQKAKVFFEKNEGNFVVSGGSVHLTNVIYNLLDNALKYSPGEPNIKVSLRSGTDQIEILVKDEGIGIPAEFRKKVFEKFFRVPTGDVHNTKGYGLGLSYVDSVIRSHRGTIEVVGDNEPGSLFRIVLPK